VIIIIIFYDIIIIHDIIIIIIIITRIRAPLPYPRWPVWIELRFVGAKVRWLCSLLFVFLFFFSIYKNKHEKRNWRGRKTGLKG